MYLQPSPVESSHGIFLVQGGLIVLCLFSLIDVLAIPCMTQSTPQRLPVCCSKPDALPFRVHAVDVREDFSIATTESAASHPHPLSSAYMCPAAALSPN